MYKVDESQDYIQKWLEAERDLALIWTKFIPNPLFPEPIDNIDKATRKKGA